MKAAIIFACLLVLSGRLYAQYGYNRQSEPLVTLSLGAHQLFINDNDLNAWTQRNYHRTIGNPVNFAADLSFAFKRSDAGIYIAAGQPLLNVGIYYGRRLTSPLNGFTSFLNVQAGVLDKTEKNIKPVNYTPTADQQGQDLKLRYSAGYVGLSSRNYFNLAHTHVDKKHTKIFFRPGFFVSGGYAFGGAWKYGYDKDNGDDDTEFKNVRIKTIPNMGEFFVDAGVFIAIGG